MADSTNEKEEILEKLLEWYRILREIYLKNFGALEREEKAEQ